ncbi:MAG: ATP-binding protein [Rhodospirillales bacterium]
MKRLVLLVNLIAFFAIGGVIGFHVWTDREHITADAISDVEKLRDALSEQTRQTFTAIDLVLTGVVENVDTANPGSGQFYSLLRKRQDVLAPTFAIFILDEGGRVVATSRTRYPEPFNFSDERMFTAHRDNASLDLFIAPPRKGKVGYAEDQWVVPLSRRMNHPDGRFAGVAAAAVSLDYLPNFYDALRLGSQGIVGVSRDDGMIITRSPFNADFLGHVLTDTKRFSDMLSVSPRGVTRVGFVADSVERIIAYAQVPGFPVVVYAGVSTDERLAAWRKGAILDGIIGVLAIILLGGASIFLVHGVGDRQRQQELRVGQLTKLTGVSTVLLEIGDVSKALQYATDMARELVPCHQAVTSLTEHPSMAQAIHTVSLSEKYAVWRDYDEKPDGSGIYREVCQANKPMRMTQAELEAHPGWRGFGEARDRHPPMRGWLAVPLMTGAGRNLGLIQLTDRLSGEFTDEDQALMMELAHITSAAIHRLKLVDDLRAAADAAERLRAEAEAAGKSEAQARGEVETILTSIRDAVYALDSAWRFSFLNRRAEELLERKAEDLIGRSVWEEFPEAAETVVYEQYHKARTENVDVDFRLYYPPLQRWFDVRAFPQAEGGLTVYFQDVSTWVTQEEQLRQAQKMEAVGLLTGGVAHDFNNLLTVIIGNTEAVLASLDKDSDQYRLVSMIGNAGTRAADLTQRLLAFSRRQPLDPRAVDVNALITDLEPLLRRTLGEQYDISFICHDGIDNALVDPGQLQNAIINLAVNARDAMPKGGSLTVTTAEVLIDQDYIETHVYAEPGRYVMVSVGDTGEGMTEEVRSRAFEPFFTTKDVGQGTGMGLSMIYGFIKQSQGHVIIYSEPGEGTEVKMYLPCAAGSAAPQSGNKTKELLDDGTERILVVEDDMMVRELTVSSLTSLGYDVTAVADGASALALLEVDTSFDLLLSDVILGGDMNGRQVADAARKALPGLKVLYMSGYTENVIVHQGRLDPGERLLSKPFRLADLAEKVRRALDNVD